MSLMETLRAKQLEARKNRNEIETNLLTTLVAEAAAKGKAAGNRESTDEEVVATIKKFLNGVNETLAALAVSSDGRVKVASIEKEILESFLPKQLSEDELRIAITGIVNTLPEKNAKAMGKVMAELKANFAGLYDGAMASKLVKELLA